jgi:hypothetical protein
MKHSQKFLQQRKFVMALPILVVPFLTMIFWALGGGKGTPAQAMSIERTGLNLELPNAHFNEEEWNKLALYERADRDSLKFNEQRESDPYFSFTSLDEQELQQEPIRKKENQTTSRSVQNPFPGKQNAVDPNEVKVNQKLDELYRELNKPQRLAIDPGKETNNTDVSNPQFSSDVKELEKMMEIMSSGDHADPEMQQIEGVLEKILDIQHPDRVREKIKESRYRNTADSN